MDIRDRIKTVIKSENTNVASFARKIGVCDQTIRGIVCQRRNNPGYDVLSKIVEAYPYLNAEWLLVEKGTMLKPQVHENLEDNFTTKELIQYIKEKDQKIEQLLEENLKLKSSIYT